MRRPKVTLPEEDPATKAAREREQRRAENTRTEETQALLLGDTVRRLRRFGRLGGGGSVPIYGASRSQGLTGRGPTTANPTTEMSQFTPTGGRTVTGRNSITLY